MFSINYWPTNLRRQCTLNVGIRLWNDLPVDITTSAVSAVTYNVTELW